MLFDLKSYRQTLYPLWKQKRLLNRNPPIETPEELREIATHKLEPEYLKWLAIWLIVAFVICFGVSLCHADTIQPERLANAIYRAENSKAFPYGIMHHYKHTTPRQACLNTIRHRLEDWNGQGDFIVYLGRTYAPIGAGNDPQGLNINWIKNVRYFYNVQ